MSADTKSSDAAFVWKAARLADLIYNEHVIRRRLLAAFLGGLARLLVFGINCNDKLFNLLYSYR